MSLANQIGSKDILCYSKPLLSFVSIISGFVKTNYCWLFLANLTLLISNSQQYICWVKLYIDTQSDLLLFD